MPKNLPFSDGWYKNLSFDKNEHPVPLNIGFCVFQPLQVRFLSARERHAAGDPMQKALDNGRLSGPFKTKEEAEGGVRLSPAQKRGDAAYKAALDAGKSESEAGREAMAAAYGDQMTNESKPAPASAPAPAPSSEPVVPVAPPPAPVAPVASEPLLKVEPGASISVATDAAGPLTVSAPAPVPAPAPSSEPVVEESSKPQPPPDLKIELQPETIATATVEVKEEVKVEAPAPQAAPPANADLFDDGPEVTPVVKPQAPVTKSEPPATKSEKNESSKSSSSKSGGKKGK